MIRYKNFNKPQNENAFKSPIKESLIKKDPHIPNDFPLDDFPLDDFLLDSFETIYIDEHSKNSEVSCRFQKIFPFKKIKFIKSSDFDRENSGPLTPKEFDFSKKNILITKFKGQFFKKCPGNHKRMACCNYFVLNLGLQCNMNCSYCYLQSFINTPYMTIYSNIEEALEELKSITMESKGLSFRIGTGEVIDSLSLDPLSLYSRKLISFFKDHPHLTLEFKTKSNYVDQFLNCEHRGNVIVSWSINPQHIIETEEHQTASLNERLLAAQKCINKGFKVSFHIDPMIWHPQWKENYSELIHSINELFSPSDIPYISLGALRFQPEQRFIMKERFNLNTYINQAELFEGPDKKLRYDQELRNKMFQYVIHHFKSLDPKWNIFLCMETPETWISTYQNLPRKVKGLEDLFYPRKSV